MVYYTAVNNKTIEKSAAAAAAAAAKLLQSCPTLCDPIDGSPPGSPALGLSRQWASCVAVVVISDDASRDSCGLR